MEDTTPVEAEGFVLMDGSGRYRSRFNYWTRSANDVKVYETYGAALLAANHAAPGNHWGRNRAGVGKAAIAEGLMSIVPCTVTITLKPLKTMESCP